MSDADRTRGQIHPIRGGKDDFRPPDGPVRRLAAILAADISGYSRLMERDEEGTYARVTRQRRELIEPTIVEHHGRLINYAGDGFVAMFDSPVEAVRCGIVIQQSMVGRNASLPREQWILYRVGVHLGDVIVEHGEIYGDGVNIAARLEGIAGPGELFISGGVYEQIKNKLVCAYQSLGDRQVKNITDPVNVYRVLPDPAAMRQARKVRWREALLALLSVSAIAIFASYLFLIQRHMANQTSTPAETQQTTRPSSPAVTANAPAMMPAPAQAPAATPRTTPSPTPAVTQVTPQLPEMVSIRGGTFGMGSDDDLSEKPIHRVTIKPFAISKFPITVREWKAFVAAKSCAYVPTGEDDAPVANLSWADAQQFVDWLSKATQKTFRLPSEAEWEYAARGGTGTKFWWGDQFQSDMANCKGCNEHYDASRPLKVGSFKPNPFGLYDMGGNIDQWVGDCWHKDYQGAPSDGSPWLDNECSSHVIRSGSWKNDPSYVRSSNRDHYDTDVRYPTHGFRVANSS
jgi:formylglycine-generating enzyme required for sulfatase activity/class 3 adenylate cyclase